MDGEVEGEDGVAAAGIGEGCGVCAAGGVGAAVGGPGVAVAGGGCLRRSTHSATIHFQYECIRPATILLRVYARSH